MGMHQADPSILPVPLFRPQEWQYTSASASASAMVRARAKGLARAVPMGTREIVVVLVPVLVQVLVLVLVLVRMGVRPVACTLWRWGWQCYRCLLKCEAEWQCCRGSKAGGGASARGGGGGSAGQCWCWHCCTGAHVCKGMGVVVRAHSLATQVHLCVRRPMQLSHAWHKPVWRTHTIPNTHHRRPAYTRHVHTGTPTQAYTRRRMHMGTCRRMQRRGRPRWQTPGWGWPNARGACGVPRSASGTARGS